MNQEFDRESSIMEPMPDPDFIEPDYGPVRTVLEFDDRGFAHTRALTAKEEAEETAFRADRAVRIAAKLAARKAERKARINNPNP